MKRLGVLCVVVGLAAASPAGHACCHSLAEGYIYYTNKARPPFDLPRTWFQYELEILTGAPLQPSSYPWKPMPSGWDRTLEADVADLRLALSEKGMAEGDVGVLTTDYKALRKEMLRHEASEQSCVMAGERQDVQLFSFEPYPRVTAGIPEEFRIYLRGAALYRANRYEDAVAAWDSLLALPEADRRYRSTWAAYMCGKALKDADVTAAIGYFERTRQLAADGFRDSAGLAWSSLGWQAHIERKRGDLVAAMNLYHKLLQAENEPDRAVGSSSLDWVCGGALRAKELDPALARDPVSLMVMTTYVMDGQGTYVSGRTQSNGKRWLKTVEEAGVDPSPEIAARLAWTAYSAGDFKRAEHWMKKTDGQCFHGEWTRAKLLMRAGKTEDAANVLSDLATKSLSLGRMSNYGPEYVLPHTYLVCEELGVVYLSLGEYAKALEVLMCRGCREDAAYVAERVMTIDELEAFIKDHENGPAEPVPGWWRAGGALPITDLRYVCARRLARANRLKEARQYYPDGPTEAHSRGYGDEQRVEMRKVVDVLADRLAKGRDASLPEKERAEHLFNAAEITRKWGMELYGTEFLPDMSVWGGSYQWHAPSRVKPPFDTTDEVARYRKHAPSPDKRFHYRYRAADLMWECAELLPDNDPMTARALYTGGMYLAEDDAEAADRFYKALVHRCGDLPLGKQADEERWFPKEPEF